MNSMGMVDPSGNLHSVNGYTFAGITVGDGEKKNLGVIVSERVDTVGTAVYTRNDVKAAPVLVSKMHDQATGSKRAILINSGTANAFTGKQGYQDALDCADTLARQLDIDISQVYLGSTGSIGQPLPLKQILSGVQHLIAERRNAAESALDFAGAIMTTDTRPKHASIQYSCDGVNITIAGIVKGAGMIMPNMATMLCTLVTDVDIDVSMLNCALKEAVDRSFHCATVDGDTSTNDTVFALANGAANNPRITDRGAAYRLFTLHLTELLEYLAKEMVGDGEGISKFITIRVLGVPERETGKTIAFSIANSPLVKTAMFGSQMNWGRILMAAGKAETGLNFDLVDLSINSIPLLRGSELIGSKALEEAEASIRGREIDISLDLHQGQENFTAWTCDFSYDYVKINADYLT